MSVPDPPRTITTTSLYWRLKGTEFWREAGNIPANPVLVMELLRVFRQAGYEVKADATHR